MSIVLVLFSAGVAAGMAALAAEDGGLLLAAVVAGFGVTAVLAVVLSVVGVRRWLLGHPFPACLQFGSVGLVAVAIVGMVVEPVVGFTMLTGLLVGLAAANIWAVRVARRNRARVDELEAATARVGETAEVRDHSTYPSRPATAIAPIAPALRTAVAVERRRGLAWLVATVLVTAAALAVDAHARVLVGVLVLGVLAPLWVLRRLWAAWLALRDFRLAATAPRRAFVVLLDDPAPRMIRPLLGVWAVPPVVREGHLPKPDRVYRCDEENEALLCHQGGVVVHEAWVDTGPRPASTPRWVFADAGIALPHRPALFGRWYLGNLIRGERPDPPEPLTVRPPHPSDEQMAESDGPGGSFLRAVAVRVVLLGVMALFLYWAG